MRSYHFATIASLGVLVSCSQGAEDAAGAEAELLAGRTIPVELPTTSGVETIQARIEAGDIGYEQLNGSLTELCAAEAESRLSDWEGVQATVHGQLLAMVRDTCRGYRFLEMADGVAPLDIFKTEVVDPDKGTIDVYRLVPRRPTDPPPADQPGEHVLTVPVLAGHGAATAALLAAREFQRAALNGADLLADPDMEPQYEATVSLGDDGGRVTAGMLAVIYTRESLEMMQDAGQVATRLIHAAAEERFARESDGARARVLSWRARTDSRLEAANLWLGVPVEHFEALPPPVGDGVSTLPLGGPSDGFPVLTWVPTRDSEQLAVDIVREAQIDPRTPGATPAADLALLQQRLQTSLAARHPDAFGATSPLGALSPAALAHEIGLEDATLRLAARYLVDEAGVRGRPIVSVGGVLVTGTELTAQPTSLATIAARSYADTIVDHRLFDEMNEFAGFDVRGYAEEGLVQTADYVSDVLKSDAVAGYLPTDAAVELTKGVDAPLTDLKRVALCTGAPTTLTSGLVQLDEVKIAIDGFPVDVSAAGLAQQYEVWWGEAGLECALHGRVGTADCDETTWRFVYDYELMDVDGLRGKVFLMAVTVAPAGAGGTLSEDGRIYVTQRSSADGTSQRRALVGFGLRGDGVVEDSDTRCTIVPVGGAVDEHLDDLTPDPAEASAPLEHCSGLRERALPLEDTLTASGVSGDFLESSFLHYLEQADRAAARAESLGERLIAEQTEMNAISDQAAQRLNEICGTTISADRLGAAMMATDPIEALGLEGDEAERLRRCLADDGELTDAAMGERRLCAWAHNGNLCECPPMATCPGTCPIFTADPSCAAALTAPAGTVAINAEPLGLVSPEVPLAQSTRSACYDLALLRRSNIPVAERSAALERVLSGAWLSQASAQSIAQSLSYEEELGGYVTVYRARRPWFSTGTTHEAPSAMASACVVRPFLTTADAGRICFGTEFPNGRSIQCGWSGASGCGDYASRESVRTRIVEAFQSLEVISGVVPAATVMSATAADGFTYQSLPLPLWLQSSLGVTGAIRNNLHEPAGLPAFYSQCAAYDTAPAFPPPAGTWDACQVGSDGRLDRAVRFTARGRDLSDDRRTWAVELWRRQDSVSLLVGARESELHGRLSPTVSTAVARASQAAAQPILYRMPRGFEGGYTAHQVSPRSVVDALELVCTALEDDVGGCPAELEELPVISSMEDIDRLGVALSCAADRFERSAERLVFRDMPATVVGDIAAARISGTYPVYGGEYGETVALLRGQMEQVIASTREVASAVRDMGGELEIARSSERVTDLEAEIAHLQTASRIAGELFRCLAAAMPTVGAGASWNSGSVFVCLDSIMQINFTVQIANLGAMVQDEERRQARTALSMRFAARMDQVADATRLLSEAYASVNASVTQLATLRQQAREEVARVVFRDNPNLAAEWETLRGLRGRHNRTRIQYGQAHRGAVQLAYLARRAIEQRIGMNLATMTDPMSLVPAPSTWADSVCTTTGVDFYDVWESSEEHLPDGIRTVADYVELLKLFLDSYMLDYSFQNARDTVVLSVRDDLAVGARYDCPTTGHNLLLSSEDLNGEAWFSECALTGGEVCASSPRAAGSVFTPAEPEDGTRLTRFLGGGSVFELRTSCSTAPYCGGALGTGDGWMQGIELAPGDYVVSWYERLRTGCAASGSPALAVALEPKASGTGAATFSGAPAFVAPAMADRWVDSGAFRRAFVRFTVPEPAGDFIGSYNLVFRRVDMLCAGTDGVFTVGWGAPQVEAADPEVAAGVAMPRVYFPTDDEGRASVGACERSSLDLRNAFTYRCDLAACPEGVGTACVTSSTFDPGQRLCFWESNFTLGLAAIDRGELIPNGGFAHGNFNYRWDTAAVNMVGTALRDCSRVPTGTEGCYASGYIPFSLRHQSGFTVRNHLGQEEGIPVFPGEIVFAKALAAERYITNPISSADRALLSEDYTRREFRGRPLNGAYRLRIHEVPGFDWSRVEDIQVVLGYRYWTRHTWE